VPKECVCEQSHTLPTCSEKYVSLRHPIEKKKLLRQQNTPCINYGKGDSLARGAVSLPHQRKNKTNRDLEGGRQPPAPDRDLESN
jgi:hypothetical protein